MAFNKLPNETYFQALERHYQEKAKKTSHLRESGKTMLEEIRELCPNIEIPVQLLSVINRAVRTISYLSDGRTKVSWTADPTQMDMEGIWYNSNVDYNICETSEQIAYFLNERK